MHLANGLQREWLLFKACLWPRYHEEELGQPFGSESRSYQMHGLCFHAWPQGGQGRERYTMTAYKFPLCLVPKNFSKSLGAWGLIIANKSESDLSVLWEIYSALHDAATKDSTSKFDTWPNSYPPDHVDSLAKAKVKISTICHLNRIAFIVFTWKGTYYTGIGVSLERPQCVGPPLLCLILIKAHSHPPPIPHPSLLNLHPLRVWYSDGEETGRSIVHSPGTQTVFCLGHFHGLSNPGRLPLRRTWDHFFTAHHTMC